MGVRLIGTDDKKEEKRTQANLKIETIGHDEVQVGRRYRAWEKVQGKPTRTIVGTVKSKSKGEIVLENGFEETLEEQHGKLVPRGKKSDVTSFHLPLDEDHLVTYRFTTINTPPTS